MTAMVAVTLTGPLAVHLFVPALPTVRRAFAVDAATAQFAFSISLFTMAVATLAYGTLSDRFGRRPVLLVGLSLFILGSAASAVAYDMATLIGGRFLQATGAACGLVLARAIVRDVYGDDRLVKMLAYLTMAYVMGPMLAPSIGGALIDNFGWRAIFYLAIAGGVAILALAAAATYETAPPAARHGGAAAGGRAASGFWSGFLGDYGRLLRAPRFTFYTLHNGFISASFLGYIAAASFLMKDVLDRSASEYGLYFLMPAGTYLCGNFIAARLSDRVRVETMVIWGGSASFAVAVGFVVVAAREVPLTPLLLFLPCAVASIFQGMTMPYAQSAAISVDDRLAGTASGALMFTHLFLGAVGVQLMGFVGDATVTPLAVFYVVCLTLALICGVAPPLLARRR